MVDHGAEYVPDLRKVMSSWPRDPTRNQFEMVVITKQGKRVPIELTLSDVGDRRAPRLRGLLARRERSLAGH
ncbi:MAG: hypothetical protein QM756_21185 [Polyangiaceae bacterium]